MTLRKTETFFVLRVKLTFVATRKYGFQRRSGRQKLTSHCRCHLSLRTVRIVPCRIPKSRRCHHYYASSEPINLPTICVVTGKAHKSSECFSICTKCRVQLPYRRLPESFRLNRHPTTIPSSSPICCVFTRYRIRSNKQREHDF